HDPYLDERIKEVFIEFSNSNSPSSYKKSQKNNHNSVSTICILEPTAECETHNRLSTKNDPMFRKLDQF
ncbi:unnamed protein product, partial [Rotaria sp. Silwood2]